jgi:Tfp pilus assembly protein PilX
MSTMSRERSQLGFAAVLAIALLVLLGSLGAAMALLSFGQQTGSASDVLGTRAYFAARAGLEWGMHHVLRSGGLDCAAVDSPANNTFAFGTPELAGFMRKAERW